MGCMYLFELVLFSFGYLLGHMIVLVVPNFLKVADHLLKKYSVKKNTFESVLMRWMKLEPIIQSEVSQQDKHQYSILTHIY